MPASRKRITHTSAPRLEWERRPEVPLAAALTLAEVVYPDNGRNARPQSDAAPDRLYLGDNLGVMSALLPYLAGKVDLIYADPPFLSGKSYPSRIGRGEDSRRPAEWLLAEGYADDWPDAASYLDMLQPRLAAMHQLLAPTGTLYLHLDWHAAHYARLLLDELFGPERLLNEIVWVYHGPSPVRRSFNRKHDTLLVYTKSADYTFNADDVRTPYDESTRRTFASSPKAGFGKVPDLDRGKVPEDWWYFPVVARLHSERTGYPTQKPEALLERILRASSRPGDLVADFFCGSGTLPAVAARLGRRWVAGDISARAVHTTKKRLIAGGASPFEVWQADGSGMRPGTLSASWAESGGEMRINLIGFQADGQDRFPEHLDYWEMDVAYDGRVFRSTRQFFRRNEAAGVPLEAAFAAKPGGDRVCVRAVSVFGERGEVVLTF